MARFEQRARLRQPAEFKAVFAQGKRFHQPLLTAVAAPSTQGHARLGLAISRKASKKAVCRNRIKRQIRESFRQQQDRLPAVDIVIMARREAAAADNSRLRADLAALWKRMNKRWADS